MKQIKERNSEAVEAAKSGDKPTFRAIPQFTRSGNYQVNISWSYLEQQLESWNDRKRSPLVLDPDFQRAHVWNEEKHIRYVEYVLRGGKASRILYFNCSSWMGNFNTPVELVDGKQRLEAARKFLRNELPVFGHLFEEYSDQLGFRADFVFVVNDLKTRAEVLQWYLDLNEGGVVHTSEELDKVRALLEAEKTK